MGRLTTPQRAGAILLGCLHTALSMPAGEALAKRSHGTPTRLVIVQDIQTAHITLGFPALPEAVEDPTDLMGRCQTRQSPRISQDNTILPNIPKLTETALGTPIM